MRACSNSGEASSLYAVRLANYARIDYPPLRAMLDVQDACGLPGGELSSVERHPCGQPVHPDKTVRRWRVEASMDAADQAIDGKNQQCQPDGERKNAHQHPERLQTELARIGNPRQLKAELRRDRPENRKPETNPQAPGEQSKQYRQYPPHRVRQVRPLDDQRLLLALFVSGLTPRSGLIHVALFPDLRASAAGSAATAVVALSTQ
jgi:hypothetical protein